MVQNHTITATNISPDIYLYISRHIFIYLQTYVFGTKTYLQTYKSGCKSLILTFGFCGFLLKIHTPVEVGNGQYSCNPGCFPSTGCFGDMIDQ